MAALPKSAAPKAAAPKASSSKIAVADHRTPGEKTAAGLTKANVDARNATKRAGRQSSTTGSIILVRLRGTVHVNGKTADTLDMLHMKRPNAATIIPKTESYLGMVQRVKDYVAYGDIDADTLVALIKARGKWMGDKPMDNDSIAKATEGRFATVDAFAKAVVEGKATLKDLGENAKPLFRLHPPTGGHKGSTKRHFTVKGELGYRGKEINELIRRMM